MSNKVTVLLGCLMAALLAWLAMPEPGAAEPYRIVAMGDSDTRGRSGAAWSFPGLIEKRLRENGYDVSVLNEGMDGLTTTLASQRLGRIPAGTNLVILHLGTSDLKGPVSIPELKQQIENLIATLKGRGLDVLLVAGRPPAPHQQPANFNMTQYYQMFAALAQEQKLPLHRFVAGLPRMEKGSPYYLPDGHLTADGNVIVANQLYPLVERFVAAAKAKQ